jgi:hypothetical protein
MNCAEFDPLGNDDANVGGVTEAFGKRIRSDRDAPDLHAPVGRKIADAGLNSAASQVKMEIGQPARGRDRVADSAQIARAKGERGEGEKEVSAGCTHFWVSAVLNVGIPRRCGTA